MRDDWHSSSASFDRAFSSAAPNSPTTLENPIPFGDLALEVREIRDEIDRAVNCVLTRGWFVLGAELEQFESAFADYLKALDIGGGYEVITVANTCVPTATGIRAANCRLKLIDCDAQTLQMDARQLSGSLIQVFPTRNKPPPS